MDSKAETYRQLAASVKALLAGERDFMANAANFSAAVYHGLPELNWAGFYLLRGEELALGPFQGKPACVRLKKPRGVCWAAVLDRRTVMVRDVRDFPGHIACDAASRAELAVPLFRGGSVSCVLDIDSPVPGRFSEEDRAGFEKLAEAFASATDLP